MCKLFLLLLNDLTPDHDLMQSCALCFVLLLCIGETFNLRCAAFIFFFALCGTDAKIAQGRSTFLVTARQRFVIPHTMQLLYIFRMLICMGFYLF